MSKYVRHKRIDSNQPEIVHALRMIPGVTAEVDHDDILVGFGGKTFWYEIKDPKKVFKKDGTFIEGAIKDSQKKLLAEWKGHYKIVWTLEMILDDMGINN